MDLDGEQSYSEKWLFFTQQKTTVDALCCARTDHKKSARGTWKGKEGGKEKSAQLVKTSRKVL